MLCIGSGFALMLGVATYDSTPDLSGCIVVGVLVVLGLTFKS